MTDFNRSVLPDAVRSNGATPNPWWANAVVYLDLPAFLPGHERRRHRRSEGHHQPSRLFG